MCSKQMIRRLISHFETQDSVKDLPIIGRPRSIKNEATVECVLEGVEEDLIKSTRN